MPHLAHPVAVPKSSAESSTMGTPRRGARRARVEILTVERSDSDLVRACLEGRQQAWDRLVERYARLVRSVAIRYGFADADADDVTQNVFIVAYRRLETLADHQRLASWLITVAHRECWRHGRRRDMPREFDERFADVNAPAHEDVLAWERQELVQRGLIRLGGRCQRLLTALFLQPGRPDYPAVAEQLGMKIGSIGPTRARCFRKLERILLDLGFTVDEEPPDPNGV